MGVLGSAFSKQFFFVCNKCMSPHECMNLNNLPFSFHTSETQFSNGCFSFSNRNYPRITLLKIRKILHLKIIALSIAIPFWHMFDLAFAASKNLCITRSKFEDHIIKFGRLQSVERKCQLLNVNVNR